VRPRGLRHLALKTRDLRGTERFYTGTLGLRLVFRSGGMLGLESPGGDDFINFFSTRRRFDPEAGGLDHFGLRFDRKGFARVRKELKEAGGAGTSTFATRTATRFSSTPTEAGGGAACEQGIPRRDPASIEARPGQPLRARYHSV
jgi:catechol 2,3-dioxygenase-like lactoylglutathione lyase family enzyme